MIIRKLSIITFLSFALPTVALASCSPANTTVVYINGINTTKVAAAEDLKHLETEYLSKYINSEVKFLNGYNQTNGKYIDIWKLTAQMFAWNTSTWNEDANGDAILSQLHIDLTTQKVMLIGYSQGTLYANETYKYLTTHGLSTGSVADLGVGAVAPYVAGGGQYFTSTNDNEVAEARRFAEGAGLAKPLPANITIPQYANDPTGHQFSDTYLAGFGDHIVDALNRNVEHLTPISNVDTAECFTSPSDSLAHKTLISINGIGSLVGTTGYVAMAGLYNGAVAAVDGAFGAIAQVGSDIQVAVGGVNGLAHSAQPQYENTNFKVQDALYGKNQTVDGEDTYQMLHEGNPSQGGAVILATVQKSNTPAPAPKTSQTPAVPIGAAPGVSPGGGGGGSSASIVGIDPTSQSQAAVTVPSVDTTAPVVSSVLDLSVQAASVSATSSIVTYTVPAATDNVDGSVVVSCIPMSGSEFVLGTTTVTCTATDTAGNSATSTFNVGVYLPPALPPANEPIVINEIAWGGGFGAPAEQWIELYNNGSDDVSLSDVVLSAADGSMYIPLSGTIAAHGYYILASSNNSIYNLKNNGWNYGVSSSLALTSTPVQLVLLRTSGVATTTLDETPAGDACGGSWCAGALVSSGFSASGGLNPMPVTMERISTTAAGTDPTNWASADGYNYYAQDFNQQRIVGTPYNANSSHWPMTGLTCQGDTQVLTPGNSYSYRPASNNCHYLSGYSNYNWSPEAVLLKGTVGSSTIVTKLSTNSGPYKDLQTDASHYYDFAGANSGDQFTVVFFEFNNNVGGQYNAWYVGDMLNYLQTGFQNDGTTASAPYNYQAISFVIP